MKTNDKKTIIERAKMGLGISSDSEFAAILNINKSTLSNWKARNTIDYDVLFSKCEKINMNWLLTGEGKMLKDEIQLATPHVEENFKLQTDRVVGLQSVPLYDLDATAGLVSLFNDSIRQVPINHLQIPDLPPCSGAVYVRGDSMYPLLKSGDIVCYNCLLYTSPSPRDRG